MEEAGYRRGSDGFYADASEGRLDFQTVASAQNEGENSSMASIWKQNGLNFNERVLPAAQARDNEIRANFPALQVGGFGARFINMVQFNSGNIPAANNRWSGQNRGGWNNAEYDRLAASWHVTLDPNERIQQIAGMLRILSEEQSVMTVYYSPVVTVHITALKNVGLSGDADATDVGDIHLWEFN
jgi:ABC-type transport system substrate-binding protein